jgi:hypothetical protein
MKVVLKILGKRISFNIFQKSLRIQPPSFSFSVTVRQIRVPKLKSEDGI